MKRNYNMKHRSQMAANTTKNIIDATERLLTNNKLENINLIDIAKEAGTTVQTVLRHMNSRDGCIKAVAHNVAERVDKQRGNFNHNYSEDAITELIDHYESEGKLVLNLLTQEHSGDSITAELTSKGRTYHRKWVKNCFVKYLDNPEKETIDALVVSTDIYVWKLLRLDLRRSKNHTKNVMIKIVKDILEEK
jgi:AcrR family transcriptional regulator